MTTAVLPWWRWIAWALVVVFVAFVVLGIVGVARARARPDEDEGWGDTGRP
jgi:hypothetical protein